MTHTLLRGSVGLLIVLLLILSLPGVSTGQTTDQTIADLQTQIQALLARVAALQSQLGGSGGTTIPVGTTPIVGSSSGCPLIGRVLYLGDSGDDVTRLQQYLARDPSVYPERLITGYYGALTEAAVKRWQVKFNIVSSGTAATTGYGQVGPRTAATMAQHCAATGGGGVVTPGTGGAAGGFIKITPTTGTVPLTVSVEATVNTVNSCAGALYTIDWGDGTAPAYISVPAGNCNQLVQVLQHQYTRSGTFSVALSSGSHRTSANVTVIGGTTTPASDSISANPSSGTAPLTVSFSGTINAARSCDGGSYTIKFGDGQEATIQYPADGCNAQSFTASHQFTSGGTYTVQLFKNPVKSTADASTVVTVTGAAVEIGPFTVTPGIDGNPLKAKVDFNIATPCSAYNLDWGDNSTPATQSQGTSCAQTLTAKTFTHTYGQAGSYTIRVVRGSQTDTASISITAF